MVDNFASIQAIYTFTNHNDKRYLRLLITGLPASFSDCTIRVFTVEKMVTLCS